MRLFRCPGQYRRAVEGALAIVLADIALDAKHRSSDDPVIQRLTRIDDALVEPGETGDCYIAVAIPNDDAGVNALSDVLREDAQPTRSPRIALEA